MEKEEGTSNIDPVLDILREEPEDVALSLLFSNNNDPKESLQNQLRAVCGELFQRVEVLNKLHGELVGREQGQAPLSGLTELYTGQDDEPVDAETLFGQIELQNQALHTKVKKSLKKLSASLEEGGVVRLLDEQNVSDSEDESAADDDDSQDGSLEEKVHAKESDDEESVSEDDDDEERKRIEARMQRAMQDMDEDDDDDSDDRKPRASDDASKEEEESLIDPAAEELNDGFFDINEMEKFADEEEEYLPDEAFGEEKPEEEEDEDKRSFHKKQRDGDLDDNEEEDSEEEENALLFKKETTVRRKRYRDEDEIDALYQLYQGGDQENDDDDSEMEATNMSAADLYGKPNKKYFETWNSKKKKTNKADDDSWDEYDFEQSEKKSGGWNESNFPRHDEEGDGSSDDDKDEQTSDDDDKDEDADEQVPMKSTDKQESKGSNKKADKLQKQTEELERETLAEKPWQMRGETTGAARPVDSLLDSTPEFEVATKQAPIITVEKTMDLEEVIKQRIVNEDWDDVIPRELPDVAWNKKRGELPEVSQEKSKLGLGELYEREYMKKALGYDADAAEKETQEEKAKNEIKSLFANLCSKLDALSNYHFAPRPIADEAEIRPVTKPAIAMEEVLPLHVSEARGVAPEEVYGAKRGRDAVIRGESELEQQDRKRLRSAKKAARRKARKEKVADEKLISKLQPGLGLNNPYEKRKMREELSVARAQGKITKGEADTNDYGKSGTFFKRMQQEAQQSIQGAAPRNMDLDESSKRRSKSSAVKL